MADKELPIIGVFPLAYSARICVHAIEGGRVRFSMNGHTPEWADVVEKPLSMITGEESDEGKRESGFMWGSFFSPFSELERI